MMLLIFKNTRPKIFCNIILFHGKEVANEINHIISCMLITLITLMIIMVIIMMIMIMISYRIDGSDRNNKYFFLLFIIIEAVAVTLIETMRCINIIRGDTVYLI